jgi:hypothetical protein
MGYVQPLVKEVSEWANRTSEVKGMWKSEGVVRRFKTEQSYIYIYTEYAQKNGAI